MSRFKSQLVAALALFGIFAFGYSNCSKPEAQSDISSATVNSASTGLSNLGIIDVNLRHKLIDSQSNGYPYAYGPSIVFDGTVYHMFFCSTGLGMNFGTDSSGQQQGDWDAIRYSSSSDGLNWSTPRVILKTTNYPTERCTCDPSVVQFNGYYYLYYSGNARNRQTVVFVARAPTIDGDYAKWTGSAWQKDAPQPLPIMAPLRDALDNSNWYGAGQQTVVNLKGTLHWWFTDDTDYYPDMSKRVTRIYYGTSRNGVSWSRTPTNVQAASVDVKYDDVNSRFVMYYMKNEHQKDAAIFRKHSKDGINWDSEQTVCNSSCAPDYVNNLGVSGSPTGHLLSPYTLLGFGAPYDLDPTYTNVSCQGSANNCWGRWDLFGGFVNSR